MRQPQHRRHISSSFIKSVYSKIPIQTLMSLTDEERDRAYIQACLEFLNKNDRILDLGCGYGRITIPLAMKGFNIEGLDISPKLLKIARENAKRNSVKVKFRPGDMRKLPYKNEIFDKILCLWSTFNHLISEEDQLKAINECFRVLKTSGAVLIDVPSGETSWGKNKIKNKQRIHIENISGVKFPMYIHDKKSLIRVTRKSKFRKYKLREKTIGRKKRLILILYK